MDLQRCFNASEDIFSLPRTVKDFYGPFGFPAPADDRRPYMSSNFVIGLDGRASFRELQGRTSGSEVSRSKEDRWLMDFLRAHHDGQLIGANTLHEESLPSGPEWDYGIDDQQLQTYRTETLAGCGKKCVQRAISPLVASFVSPERIFTGMCRVVGAPSVRFSTVRRHYDPDSLLGNRSGHQVSHAYQVVGRAGEGKHPIHFQRSAMPHLAQ